MPAFVVDDDDMATLEVFKSLEVAVRAKGAFADMDFGAALAPKAFYPVAGPLRD